MNYEVSKQGDTHYLLCAVLIPDRVDLQGDIVSVEEISKAIATYNQGEQKVFLDHARQLADSEALIVESFAAPVPMEIGGQKIPVGAWLVKIQVGMELYERARRGEVKGVSVQGSAQEE